MTRQLVLCVMCAAAGAQASGFYFGDNGTKAMMQGGAFTGQADDLTATMYNPAGLTQLQGFQFLGDIELIISPGHAALHGGREVLIRGVLADVETHGPRLSELIGASFGAHRTRWGDLDGDGRSGASVLSITRDLGRSRDRMR